MEWSDCCRPSGLRQTAWKHAVRILASGMTLVRRSNKLLRPFGRLAYRSKLPMPFRRFAGPRSRSRSIKRSVRGDGIGKNPPQPQVIWKSFATS